MGSSDRNRSLYRGLGSRVTVIRGQQLPDTVSVGTAVPLRLYPDINRQPLTTIPAGTSLKLIKSEGDWLLVVYRDPGVGERQGYIPRSASNLPGSTPPNVPTRQNAVEAPGDPRQSSAGSRNTNPAGNAQAANLARPTPESTSAETTLVRLTITLVDADLNIKPVTRHAVLFKSERNQPVRVVSGFDGKAEARVPSGSYVLESEKPVDFQGKSYRWSKRVLVSGSQTTIDVSADDAIASAIGSSTSTNDLPTLFRRWQDSVVTVWSETGHGSGFVIDARGLIVTNQHVVGLSDYAAVQFSDALKVPATVVSRSPEKDVAVLRVNPKHVADISPVTLGYTENGRAPAVEGQQVFTIGSPTQSAESHDQRHRQQDRRPGHYF